MLILIRDRIVAVFALGQEWQFKGWKWKQPVEIFNSGKFILLILVCGFSLKFTDEPPKSTVQSWKVEQLNVIFNIKNLDQSNQEIS